MQSIERSGPTPTTVEPALGKRTPGVTGDSLEHEAPLSVEARLQQSVEGIRSLRDLNPGQVAHQINTEFLQKVIDAAEAGELTSTRPDPATGELQEVVLSAKDIVGQLGAFMKQSDKSPKDSTAALLNISRTGGLRAAVASIVSDEGLREPLNMAIITRQAELARQEKEATHTNPEVFPVGVAIQDLGEEAVEAAGVVGPDPSSEEAARAAYRLVEGERNGLSDYERQKLAPVTRPPERPIAENEYAYLFAENEAVYDANMQARAQQERQDRESPEGQRRAYYDKFVTLKNRQEAVNLLEQTLKAQPAVRDVLARHGFEGASLLAVDAIREDGAETGVRFEVAKILLDKLALLCAQKNIDFGPRIVENSPTNLKTDPLTNESMTSRLYAVRMALKMIGGEFSWENASKDTFDRSSDGRVILGQHSHAARSLLSRPM